MHPFPFHHHIICPDYSLVNGSDNMGNTVSGDMMTEGKDFLNAILITVQNEQVNIESILKTPMRPSLRRCLESQMREYSAIEREIASISYARGWELRELEPAARAFAKFNIKRKMLHGHSDSNAAALRIESSTKGLIASLKEKNQFTVRDPSLMTVSQRLLDCENANIRQMQGFL